MLAERCDLAILKTIIIIIIIIFIFFYYYYWSLALQSQQDQNAGNNVLESVGADGDFGQFLLSGQLVILERTSNIRSFGFRPSFWLIFYQLKTIQVTWGLLTPAFIVNLAEQPNQFWWQGIVCIRISGTVKRSRMGRGGEWVCDSPCHTPHAAALQTGLLHATLTGQLAIQFN